MNLRAPRVLVVDDDADHRVLIERTLVDAGAEVTVARNADEALDGLHGVDLVLLDYKLPGADGLEVLAEIRRRDDGSPGHPSVVMVTGMGSADLVATAMREGAVDFVVKDTSYFAALPAVVDRAWRHHEVRTRARRLQGLMLLVASASDRSELLDEIVRGASELFAADSCSLVLVDDAPVVAARTGDARGDVLGEARAVLAGEQVVLGPGTLAVGLPDSSGETVAVVVVSTSDDRELSEEEARLARSFAAFAGSAIERMRRTELERALVVELQRTIDQRHDFIASVSHELRTPLACILGFGETLATHWASLADGDRLDLIARIGRHGTELKELVDQLLDAAARQKGRLETGRQPLDLSDSIRPVIDGLSPVIAGRDIVVDVPPVRVIADGHLLGRVVTNLVSNAVKYSAPGQPIEVTATTEDTHVRVAVRDHGVGLAPDEARRVFEPFWRGTHATTTAARGTGIGLALVREYVVAMGGTVEVRSVVGEGSTFSFTVPLAPADITAPA